MLPTADRPCNGQVIWYSAVCTSLQLLLLLDHQMWYAVDHMLCHGASMDCVTRSLEKSGPSPYRPTYTHQGQSEDAQQDCALGAVHHRTLVH